MNALLELDKPLIAAVQGAAIGGGTTMLLHYDFVYAGESARFQMPPIEVADQLLAMMDDAATAKINHE